MESAMTTKQIAINSYSGLKAEQVVLGAFEKGGLKYNISTQQAHGSYKGAHGTRVLDIHPHTDNGVHRGIVEVKSGKEASTKDVRQALDHVSIARDRNDSNYHHISPKGRAFFKPGQSAAIEKAGGKGKVFFWKMSQKDAMVQFIKKDLASFKDTATAAPKSGSKTAAAKPATRQASRTASKSPAQKPASQAKPPAPRPAKRSDKGATRGPLGRR
jgi:hypothetical protein